MAKKKPAKRSEPPGSSAAFAPEISQPPDEAPGTRDEGREARGENPTRPPETDAPGEPDSVRLPTPHSALPTNEAPQLAGEVQLAVPLAEVEPEEGGYVPRHLDGRLTHAQGAVLRRINRGLDAAGARLANGKRPDGNVDTVRWLLEQVGSKIGSP